MNLRLRPFVLAAVALALGGVLYWDRRPRPAPAAVAPSPPPPVAAAVDDPAARRPPPARPRYAEGRRGVSVPPAPASPNPGRSGGPSADSPDAAVDGVVAPDGWAALPYVGNDPLADAVWFDAITDPTVPAAERRALITDLAADGLSDAQPVTDDDVALIRGRLALIEQIAPDAADAATAAALDQARAALERLLPEPPPADRPGN